MTRNTLTLKILVVILSLSSASSLFLNCFLYRENLILAAEKQLLEGENEILKSKIEVLDVRLGNADAKIVELTNENQKLRIIIEECGTGTGIKKLRDPSYVELKKFLQDDKISEQRYADRKRVCIHFAKNLMVAGRQAGLNISFVVINVRDIRDGTTWGHALNGCYLSNGTFVYIEPQTDEIYYSLNEFLEKYNLELINYAVIW